jgi:hypothetical protein
MSIELTCSCGKRLQVADEHAGKEGQCPVCGGRLQIPDRDASLPGLDALFGPGWLEHLVTPHAESAAPLQKTDQGGLKAGDPAKLTAVGCVLTLLTLAVMVGVAIPIVRWRDPATGQPLPRSIAILSPLLIGAAVHGIAMLVLRVIGVRVWSTQEKGAGK